MSDVSKNSMVPSVAMRHADVVIHNNVKSLSGELDKVLSQSPDAQFLSFHAGANDVIRPKYDPEKTISTYNSGVDKLVKSNASLMLFCVLEDTGARTKAAKIWQERFAIFNENIRRKAAEVGAILFDPNLDKFWQDTRFIDADRLHLNSEGHRRVAQAVLSRFDLPHDSNWRATLPPAKPDSVFKKVWNNVKWFITFAIPWMIRRLRGRSSGDGRSCKYPVPIAFKN